MFSVTWLFAWSVIFFLGFSLSGCNGAKIQERCPPVLAEEEELTSLLPLAVAPNYLDLQKVDPDGEHKTAGKHASNEFSVWKGGISHMFSQIRGDSPTPEWWSRSRSKLCMILPDEWREMFYSVPHAVSYIYTKCIFVHVKILSIRGYCNCNRGLCTAPLKTQQPQEGCKWPWHHPAVKLLVQVTQAKDVKIQPANPLQESLFPLCTSYKAYEFVWPDKYTTSTLFSLLW